MMKEFLKTGVIFSFAFIIASCATPTPPKKTISYKSMRADCKAMCSYFRATDNYNCNRCCDSKWQIKNLKNKNKQGCVYSATKNNAKLNKNIKDCYFKNYHIQGDTLRACVNAK